mgnify:CR=1 FL=1
MPIKNRHAAVIENTYVSARAAIMASISRCCCASIRFWIKMFGMETPTTTARMMVMPSTPKRRASKSSPAEMV